MSEILIEKSSMSGQYDYNILDAFALGNKLEKFKLYSEKYFVKDNDGKEIMESKIGCDKIVALEYAKKLKNEYNKIKISSRKREISDIKDIFKQTIVFENSKKIYGWLIFIDEDIFANWGHDCRYIFYVNSDLIFEKQMLFPPSRIFVMEEL